MKTNMDSQTDFLQEINDILAKNRINLSGAPAPVPAAQAQVPTQNGISLSAITEMMAAVHKAELNSVTAIAKIQVEAKEAERIALKTQLDSLTEQLSTVNSTLTEVQNTQLAMAGERDDYKLKFEAESLKVAEKEKDEKEKLEAADAKIAELDAKIAELSQERDGLKEQNVALGSQLAGVTPAQAKPQGDVAGDKISLSAEEAARLIAEGNLTDAEKLMVQFDQLETLAHTVDENQAINMAAYNEFLMKNAKELGIPLV
jgi:chromosome segregation ATPase